jgi:hypothetical protein
MGLEVWDSCLSLTFGSAFDGKGFVSGVQLMANNFANVMLAGGTGQVGGIGNVLTTVLGNENINFGAAT